jgi:hypothetical protein
LILIDFELKMSDPVPQISSRRFSLSSHLAIADISEAPSAWFPRLREAQTLLVSFYLLDYHNLGGNHYYPAYSPAEIVAHNAAFPLNEWAQNPSPATPQKIAENATAAQIEI